MKLKSVTNADKKTLLSRVEVPVRFSEVDSLHVVWHGHYVRYFEDGREAFGKKFDLDYLGFFKEGFFVPIVKLICDFKAFLEYGDTAIIETRFVDSLAAKIIFEYNILSKSSGEPVATGSTMQVFTDTDKNLQLTVPAFFSAWRERWGIA